MGLDYPIINDSLVIPADSSDTIFIYPNLDTNIESTETVILVLFLKNVSVN